MTRKERESLLDLLALLEDRYNQRKNITDDFDYDYEKLNEYELHKMLRIEGEKRAYYAAIKKIKNAFDIEGGL